MLEPLFGSAAPMWTTLPPSGFGLQAPIGFANGAIGPPAFGSSGLAALPGTTPAPPQSLPGPGIPASAYGYGSGLIPIVPQSFAGPLARTPMVVGTEPFGLTAASLLSAVAMRRGQPQGPATDPEIEDFIYDALEMLPGASDIEVRCEGGRATLSGTVQHKRTKHDAGEIAWAIPVLHDVQNNLTIASRRRTRGGAREGEGANPQNRKQG
jgi:BON domain-containing protein